MAWRCNGEREISDHPCECGCGEYTLLSPATDPRYGHVKGEPMRYVYGHAAFFERLHFREPEINEQGLCFCGCGETTPVATRNIHRLGHIKGEHVPYVAGHNTGRKTGVGLVYFISDDESPVKVGWTTTLARRLSEFQTAHWVELRVLGTISATAEAETHCHRELAAYRVRGEWFEREPALALLARLSRGTLDDGASCGTTGR